MSPDARNELREQPELTPHQGEEDQPATQIIELSREECLRLLASQSLGRIAVSTSEGTAMIRPVNYTFDGPSQSVVFRTGAGSKFHALVRSTTAAFEIDGIDEGLRSGWSVIVRGVTDEVTNVSEIRRLARSGLEPLSPGKKSHWMHIRARTVSGRRIVRVADPGTP